MYTRLEKILITLSILATISLALNAFQAYRILPMLEPIVSVDCYPGEPPQACQSRLGPEFNVIYSAQTNQAWGELIQ